MKKKVIDILPKKFCDLDINIVFYNQSNKE
jgi:hypothetical protein